MAQAIMIQGTMSGVGKTLLCAGLGRALRREGYRVAPFKAQNMAPNAHITDDGLTMGRAQAMQAEACGAAPDARMNPILLRPVSDTGSQVIVNGRPRGVLRAREYFALRPSLVPEVAAAYEALAREYDVIVIEGAGSPAEINLGPDEFVNMGMARIAGAPVLLAGDIDRGGVFAQLYGTLLLLAPGDRARVRGLILNKFRGDLSLLAPGLAMLEELTGVPAAGVVPWLEVDIDDEDSLAVRGSAPAGAAELDIAVVKLPRMADFSELAPLRGAPGVCVRYVERGKEAGRPDLLIVPDTRSPAADLRRLRENGLAGAMAGLASAGTPVLGLGGGYALLGQTLPDETAPGQTAAGLGLLPAATPCFDKEEEPPGQVRGNIAPLPEGCGVFGALAGVPVAGRLRGAGGPERPADAAAPFIVLEDGTAAGCVSGNVCGTALRGIFDSAPCRDALLGALFARRGLAPPAPFDFAAYRERQYDLLADGVAAGLNMALVHKIMGREG